jgi:hypothetical protein
VVALCGELVTLRGVIRLGGEGGGVSKLKNYLLKLARKEKKKTTDLEVGAGFTTCFTANNRWRSQGR